MNSFLLYLFSILFTYFIVSLLDRFAIVNLLHEARGLDTYPISLKKFQSHNSSSFNSSSSPTSSHRSEFDRKNYCIEKFHEIVRKYYLGAIKGPFNEVARDMAGMTREWYIPLSLPDSK